jgi:signal transduction histidine kinase
MNELRIAVVAGSEANELVARLQGLADRPTVRAFGDLYADAERLVRFRPAALFWRHASLSETDAGAARLLHGLQPELALVLVAPRAHEVALDEPCRRLGFELLAEPFSTAQLAGVVAKILDRQPREAAETLRDLAAGIGDEINNPLLFVSGYVQLLGQQLADDPDRARALTSMREGLARIEATVAKLQILARAENGGRSGQRLDLGALVAEVLGAHGGGVACAGNLAQAWVRGDPDLLRAAVRLLVEVATALAQASGRVVIGVAAAGDTTQLTVTFDGEQIAAWRLPRTFTPYYLNRFLRGTPHGLNLFAVQAIVLGHGGKALARRDASGAVALELSLPGAAPGAG